MAVFLLIRHGSNDLLGKAIAGRIPGVHLNKEGQAQALRLAERLASVPIDAIYCSPLERTQETVAPLAEKLGLEIRTYDALNEIDFGEWNGRTLEDLKQFPKWGQFNLFRCGMRIPGGEMVVEVQARMVGLVESIREEFPEGVIALVSHGDPIKTVIAHYGGIPLDFLLRLEVSPASVSIVAIDDWGPRILCVNSLDDLPKF